MAYVAARGGERAILNSEKLYHVLNGELSIETVRAIRDHLPYLVDRVMGESSLYAPDLAALAIAQAGGDLHEAVLLLRAYRSTQPRIAYASAVTADQMLTVRRISAAFKDIPGGQILGPSLDYSHRLLRMDVLDGGPAPDEAAFVPAEQPAPPQYPMVADWHRDQGFLPPLPQDTSDPATLADITKDPLMLPAPRAHRLQSLARADTGGVLALGYSVMRGYGLSHPTVNELRLGYADVRLKHPITGEAFSAGRVRVSQAEVVTEGSGGKSGNHEMRIGFTATLGWNEVKIIAGATLDMAMDEANPHPAHQEEFVLYHTEAVEASGFCIHFKLPHYVTFASNLDALRGVLAQMYGATKDLAAADTANEADAAPTNPTTTPEPQPVPEATGK
jgi:alpha-D-ribose 1-methylphosphonate 5-triphosphate synthase subunit PhnI